MKFNNEHNPYINIYDGAKVWIQIHSAPENYRNCQLKFGILYVSMYKYLANFSKDRWIDFTIEDIKKFNPSFGDVDNYRQLIAYIGLYT